MRGTETENKLEKMKVVWNKSRSEGKVLLGCNLLGSYGKEWGGFVLFILSEWRSILADVQHYGLTVFVFRFLGMTSCMFCYLSVSLNDYLRGR